MMLVEALGADRLLRLLGNAWSGSPVLTAPPLPERTPAGRHPDPPDEPGEPPSPHRHDAHEAAFHRLIEATCR